MSFSNEELRRLLRAMRSGAESFEALQLEFEKARHQTVAAERKAVALERDLDAERRRVASAEAELVAVKRERDAYRTLLEEKIDGLKVTP